MLVNCGGTTGVFTTWRRQRARFMCLASHLGTERLRAQLDQLHSEAAQARTKGNNARLRLMRLSEATEKLRRQASISIQIGRENDARDLLFQKKNIMRALDKSKARITFFDELSSKLNEAISVKETQLIENIASEVDIGSKASSGTDRIVSRKDEDTGNKNEGQADQLYYPCSSGNNMDNLSDSLISNIRNEADIVYRLKGISSYEDFIEHLDQQLNTIETELVMVWSVSKLVLEENEKPKNSKVQQIEELLEGVRNIRKRYMWK